MSKGVRLIIKKEDKYLLCQHNQTPQYDGDIREPDKIGMWSFPGGHTEGNETEEETIQRELYEEFHVNNSQAVRYIEKIKYRTTTYKIFEVSISEDIKYFDKSEIVNIRWFTVKEMRKLAKSRTLHTGHELKLVEKSLL
jgi:ADP-ribose pyrophosphatase YjhB (NUDIX family)